MGMQATIMADTPMDTVMTILIRTRKPTPTIIMDMTTTTTITDIRL